MAHLAALTITQYDMLAECERAPDGIWDESTASELSFEAPRDCNSNLSTDSCAEFTSASSTEDEHASTIALGQRLPVFQ